MPSLPKVRAASSGKKISWKAFSVVLLSFPLNFEVSFVKSYCIVNLFKQSCSTIFAAQPNSSPFLTHQRNFILTIMNSQYTLKISVSKNWQMTQFYKIITTQLLRVVKKWVTAQIADKSLKKTRISVQNAA